MSTTDLARNTMGSHRYVQGKDGKMAGSIGAGKTSIPSAADTATASSRTPDSNPADTVFDAYAAYRNVRPTTGDVTVKAAVTDPHSTAAHILQAWKQRSGTTGQEQGSWQKKPTHETTSTWTSTDNPAVSMRVRIDPTAIFITGDHGERLVMELDSSQRVVSMTHYAPEPYGRVDQESVNYRYDASGSLSDTPDRPAVTHRSGDQPHTYEFYSNGTYRGKQVWRTLYDANGQEVPDRGMLSGRARKRVVGDVGAQWPIGTRIGLAGPLQ